MGNPTACARAACAVLLTTILTIGSFGAALAQAGAFDVTGTVTANDGSPIAGASVALSSQAGSVSARSDARGSFTFSSIRPARIRSPQALPVTRRSPSER